MHSNVIQIGPQASLAEAAEMMTHHGVDTLLVMVDDTLLGVLGLRDLFTAPLPSRANSRVSEQRTEQQLLETWQQVQVQELIAEDPALTVSEDFPLMKAAALMMNTGKHPLAVTQQGKVVGVLARSDVVRGLLAEPHRLPIEMTRSLMEQAAAD
jgi:CBS domain-containing protein